MHDYDSLFTKEFSFTLRGENYTLRTPTALAGVEERRVQFIDHEGTIGKDDFKPKFTQMERSKSAYIAAATFKADGSQPSYEDVLGWPEPVVDDLYKRAKAFCSSEDQVKNSPTSAPST